MELIAKQCDQPSPKSLVLDLRTYELYYAATEEQRRFEAITSPVGLRQLFPALH